MKLNDKAIVYIPSVESQETAFNRTTHMAISAHQDDVEIMAQQGIISCYQKSDCGFAAVIVTNGSGSPRIGEYEHFSDEQMMALRCEEQKNAANIGDYSALVMFNHSSADVKKSGTAAVLSDLCETIIAMKPEIIYTHNLADKHLTHIGVAVRVIEALRMIDPQYWPKKLYGCEVWRALDWLNDDEKTVFNLTGYDELRLSLLSVFQSQISGGKRYDLATMGRQTANATFYVSHDVDNMKAATYAMDLTPLMAGGNIEEYMLGYIKRFSDEVSSMLQEVIDS
jgi:LmbE family N-acetylglucosaminyl deacetylase